MIQVILGFKTKQSDLSATLIRNRIQNLLSESDQHYVGSWAFDFMWSKLQNGIECAPMFYINAMHFFFMS